MIILLAGRKLAGSFFGGFIMNLNIAVIAGDGIGPEIVAQARKVLDRVCDKYGHTITYRDILMGGSSIDVYGVPLTDETIETARNSDA